MFSFRFVGAKAYEHRGALTLSHPVNNGAITNWDDMEALWMHLFNSGGEAVGDEGVTQGSLGMTVDDPSSSTGGNQPSATYVPTYLPTDASNQPIIMSTNSITTVFEEELIAEVMFEKLNVPSLYMGNPAVFSLLATGRTTGLVVECGAQVTACTPIYEGFCHSNSIVTSNIGGVHVDQQLSILMSKLGSGVFRPGMEPHSLSRVSSQITHGGNSFLFQDIKEKTSFVALSPKHEEVKYSVVEGIGGRSRSLNARNLSDTTSSVATYTLPDGQVIHLGSERFMAAEVLFSPKLMGMDTFGASQCVVESLLRSDVSTATALGKNIILAGGTTCLPGFAERLRADLRAAPSAPNTLRIWAPRDRKIMQWVGASIFSSLSTSRQLSVSKQEWIEQGQRVLDKWRWQSKPQM